MRPANRLAAVICIVIIMWDSHDVYTNYVNTLVLPEKLRYRLQEQILKFWPQWNSKTLLHARCSPTYITIRCTEELFAVEAKNSTTRPKGQIEQSEHKWRHLWNWFSTIRNHISVFSTIFKKQKGSGQGRGEKERGGVKVPLILTVRAHLKGVTCFISL